jgi:histidinol-phosphate phosphatase family protein
LINRKAPPHDYIRRIGDFHFLPGAQDAIRRLNVARFLVFVVTNQRGVARGMMTLADVESIHRHMCDRLLECGAHVDEIFVCPHNEGECNCRKPGIGLFLQAEQRFDIDKTRSWMIGDSLSDEQAGQRYGIRTIVTTSLPDAVDRIL